MHFKRMVLLSILVPTRNRAGDLKRCLALIADAVDEAHCSDKIEVVCVDNWSVDDTPEVIAAARARMPYLRAERHHEERPSAEASYFHGAAFCRGEFVWSFGDDDEIDRGALTRLIPLLGAEDFYLINMRIADGRLHHYILSSSANVRYGKASDLVKDLGVVSATTTLSCLCIRRSLLKEAIWARYLGLSLIYSHSCALLAMCHYGPAMFVGEPVLTYKMNTVTDEFSRISRVMTERGKSPYAPWTSDLVSMLFEVAKDTGLSIGEIANFEEIEFSKTDYNTKHTILWCFVLYHMTQQLSLAVHEGVSSWLAPADELKLLEFFRQAGPEAEGLFRELAAAAIWIIPSPQRELHVEELVSRHRAKLQL